MRFFYWHSPLPYATHKNRWTGGYVPTSYCYYPPNIPGEFFEQAQLAPEPGHVFFGATPRFLAAFEERDSEGVPSSPILMNPAAEKIRYLPLDNPESLGPNGRRARAVESNRNRRVFVSTHRY